MNGAKWQWSWVELDGSMIEDDAGFLVWPEGENSLQALMQGDVVASVWGDDKNDEAAIAKCRLIAAAPDLLDALEGLLPSTFTGPPNRQRDTDHWVSEQAAGNGYARFVLAAYAAIAKATGAAS